MVFTYSGGDTMVEEFIHNLPAKEKWNRRHNGFGNFEVFLGFA
jgi:hypothetical protein